MPRKLEQALYLKTKETLQKHKSIEYQLALETKNANEIVYLANKAFDLMHVREFPVNSNRGPDVELIQETVGKAEREAWCVAQQQSAVAFAEVDLGITSKLYTTESCASLRAHENGMEVDAKDSKRGDLWIFIKPSGKGHIACFVRWIEFMKSAVTLEGNTTAGKVGDEIVREGGGSYQCERLVNTESMKLKMVIRPFEEINKVIDKEVMLPKEIIKKENKVFDKAFKMIIDSEGGYNNHPNDSGGPTNFGITIGTLSSVLGRTAQIEDVKSLTLESAKRIYLERYWNKMNLDLVNNDVLALLLFDQCVNTGVGAASKRIQKIVGVSPDGEIGKVTIKAINSIDPLKLCFEFIKDVQDNYVNIVKKNNSQLVFLAGWINRSQKLLDLVKDNVQFKNEA